MEILQGFGLVVTYNLRYIHVVRHTPKDAFIPKTTVESKYREKIDRAVAYRRAHGEPDLTISQWIRQACAELAKYDLEDA